MPDEQISVDDLLTEQGKQDVVRVTIEAISDDSERVKVTPFVAGVGCSCDQALNLKKEQIGSVSKTGDTHLCCGQRLLVVEVTFVDETLTDLFRQLTDPARLRSPRGGGSQFSSFSLDELRRLESPRGGMLRRRFPRANPRFASDEQVLSTEEAALGAGGWHPLEDLFGPAVCNYFRASCLDRCRELQVAFGLDEGAFFRCAGDCEDAYARCLQGR